MMDRRHPHDRLDDLEERVRRIEELLQPPPGVDPLRWAERLLTPTGTFEPKRRVELDG